MKKLVLLFAFLTASNLNAAPPERQQYFIKLNTLFVQPNATVVAALVMAAVLVSGALFLIVELNMPFSGLLQLSSAPAHATLAALGK